MPAGKELYWPFECERGHTFDYGPVHDPTALISDEQSNTVMTDPEADAERYVPEETRGCPECAKEIPLTEAANVTAHKVEDGKAVYKSVDA